MSYTIFSNGTLPAINDETLNNMQIELMKLVFPVGSTYCTQDNTNPSEILKFGTWERVKGKVLVGLDEDDTDFNEIGKTGGVKTQEHDLNTASAVASIALNTNGNIDYGETQATENIAKTYTVATGGSGKNKSISNKWGAKLYGKTSSESNLQPYEVLGYMWKRTA